MTAVACVQFECGDHFVGGEVGELVGEVVQGLLRVGSRLECCGQFADLFSDVGGCGASAGDDSGDQPVPGSDKVFQPPCPVLDGFEPGDYRLVLVVLGDGSEPVATTFTSFRIE